MTTRRFLISGRVQGVGYRAWFRAEARRLGLAGWVRNRMDGSVEAMVSGDPVAIEGLAAACQAGPPPARVTSVDLFDEPDEDFEGFEQRSTV